MLGGRITNQDEEEVEDELAALEREVNGPGILPAVPNTNLSPSEEVTAIEEERQPEDQAQKERRPERQAMLAS
jgi:charged multivesicular body protein 6